jgi:hypothetical protein
MELSCEGCATKMPPKSEFIGIGGRCFLGRASVLFDTAVKGTHWIRPGVCSGFFYEYGKDTHAGFGRFNTGH